MPRSGWFRVANPIQVNRYNPIDNDSTEILGLVVCFFQLKRILQRFYFNFYP